MASDFEVTRGSKRISQSVMRTDYNWFTEYVKLFKTETVKLAKNASIVPSFSRVLSNGLSKIEVDLQTQPSLELWIFSGFDTFGMELATVMVTKLCWRLHYDDSSRMSMKKCKKSVTNILCLKHRCHQYWWSCQL